MENLNDYLFILLWYYIILNIIMIILMFYDKKTAIKNHDIEKQNELKLSKNKNKNKSNLKNTKSRIRERDFFLLGFAGGSFGGLLSMKCFRHKTKHTIFYFMYGFASFLHIVLIYTFIKNVVMVSV